MQLQRESHVLFVPTGGGILQEWAVRFAAMCCREFHLLDRKAGAATERRQRAAQRGNDRSGCHERMTSKCRLENYLHSQAMVLAGGEDIAVDDEQCIDFNLARHWYELIPQATPWPEISRRARRRLICRAKRWLNRQAVDQLTVKLLEERDSEGKVLNWLAVIAELATT